MGTTEKYKRRILTFLAIPLLMVIPFLTDDLMLRMISAVLLVVYVGFIIFLRRDSHEEKSVDAETYPNDYKEQQLISPEEFKTDFGEDFKIISKNKNIEILTSETIGSVSGRTARDILIPSDFKETFEKIVNEEIPADINHDEQFGFVIEKILKVIQEAYTAHTAAFFWYNKNKNRLTLDKFQSVTTKISNRKFPVEDDVLGKIVEKEEPELLTDIPANAEHDVIRYYTAPLGIKSFVGVPMFYGKALTGVIILDSKQSDAFGIEQVYSLGRIARVISIIISLFEEKFAETQAEKRLNTLVEILGHDKDFENESDIYSLIENSVAGLIDWDVFTLVAFSTSENKFKTAKIMNKTSLKYVGEYLDVDLQTTLVGKCILSGMPVKIDDTSNIEIPRFSKNEDVSFDGSFLTIPLIYDGQNYGVLCFESLKKNVYSNNEITYLKNATKLFALRIHSFSTINILKGLLSVDVETRVLNLDSFIERFTIDIVRSKEIGLPGALALIQIDAFLEQETLFESDPFPKVLKSIAETISDEITPLTLMGRLSSRVFAVYFFNTSPKEAFLWAEKLRIKIARKHIAVVSKQTSFTVSIGVAATTNKSDVQDIMLSAEMALKKATEGGGNSVKSTS